MLSCPMHRERFLFPIPGQDDAAEGGKRLATFAKGKETQRNANQRCCYCMSLSRQSAYLQLKDLLVYTRLQGII